MSNPASSQQKKLQQTLEQKLDEATKQINAGLARRALIGAMVAQDYIRNEFNRLTREGHLFDGTNALDATITQNPHFPTARAMILEAEFSRALKREPERATA